MKITTPESIVSFFHDRDQLPVFKPAELPEFDMHWMINESKWPYLKIELPDCPYAKMLEEAKALRDMFASHRSADVEGGYQHAGWRSLCVHGLSATQTDFFAKYGNWKSEAEVPFAWTEIAERCPETVRYFKDIFPHDRYYRLRYMLLEPGGYIQPHQDRNFNLLSPVNLALNNPERCFFKMEGKGYVPFESGTAFAVDIGNKHAVWNESDEDRYHMIVHGEFNHLWSKWEEIVRHSYSNTRKKYL